MVKTVLRATLWLPLALIVAMAYSGCGPGLSANSNDSAAAAAAPAFSCAPATANGALYWCQSANSGSTAGEVGGGTTQ